jgi:hypothetical protein
VARGLLEMDDRALDSVVVIAYNFNSPWYNPAVRARADYYNVTGTPTTFLDGTNVHTNSSQTTCYPILRAHFDRRKTVPSPLLVSVSAAYDSLLRQGRATISVRNTSAAAVSGRLQLAINERHIAWITLDSLPTVFRALLPDANGETLTIPARDSLVRTRDFVMEPTWIPANCEFVAFVQDDSTHEILQGGRCALVPAPRVKYLGYHAVLPQPGADADLTIDLRNIGTGPAREVSAALSTGDPEIQVLDGNRAFGDIAQAATAASVTPFRIHVRNTCPAQHLTRFELRISGVDTPTDTTSFPLLITDQYGFFDDVERGENGWTHFGYNDQWHPTMHQFHSPGHSWWCGAEDTWYYRNDNDAHLVTPFFATGTNRTAIMWQYYNVEPEYDYCIVELNNGSSFWQQLSIREGRNSGWQATDYDLSNYTGQTVRFGFRFVSDSLTTGEGWYIDDLTAGAVSGLAERAGQSRGRLSIASPVNREAEIRYEAGDGRLSRIEIDDVSGRQIRRLASGLSGTGTAVWNLLDDRARRVQSGVYFVRLISPDRQSVTRVTVAR